MSLDWGKFNSLSGAQNKNFELLCRGVVRHTFGQYGQLVAYANMPGVEFYLDLNNDCSLGKKDRVFGWQCKWFDLRPGQSIGQTRRKNIEEGIEKTKKYHPKVTDWVLWTKNTLSKEDQIWFNNLDLGLKLHLYDLDDIEKYKSGQSEVFMKSFFGELVISEQQMAELTEISIAPIKSRWHPELHQETELDRRVKKILGCQTAWKTLGRLSDELEEFSSILLENLIDYEESSDYLNDAVTLVIKALLFCDHLRECVVRLNNSVTDWVDFIDDSQDLNTGELSVSRRFRQKNDFNGLMFTNLLASYQEGKKSLVDLKKSLKQRSLVISSEAGNGKTEFCAQLCSGEVNGVQGIIIHGKRLSINGQYNELAKSFPINGKCTENLESLICALNSYGERNKKRILIAFDGLNESEDSRMWAGIIPEIQSILKKYQRVFCLFTIRPDYAPESLPRNNEIEVINGEGFSRKEDAAEAVRKYFAFYKIKSVGGSLPTEMLRHPLSLKLFCEVVNPSRNSEVSVNSGPQSLYDLLERFIHSSSDRIAELSHNNYRIGGGDALKAFSVIGGKLWLSGQRGLEQEEFKKITGDLERPWNFSFLNLAVSEGALIRNRHALEEVVMPVYDRLAGYLIAKSILSSCSAESFKNWIDDQDNFKKLFGSYDEKHPYHEDIVSALIVLLPKTFYGKNLWMFLDGGCKDKALIESSELEKVYLEQSTIVELEKLIVSGKATASLWNRLYFLHSLENHPLNYEFTERVLSSMDIATRDRCWSEWVRQQKEGIIPILKNFSKIDEELKECIGSASYFKWCLTLTDREIRDVASKSLFIFGHKSPVIIFDETLKSLNLDDDYIAMRLVPVSFGIITNIDVEKYKTNIVKFYKELSASLTGSDAENPTNNIVIREYFLKIREYLLFCNIIEAEDSNIKFSHKEEPKSIAEGEALAQELSRALHMDFENYTLGTLFKDRRNYDNKHQGHKECVNYIRGLLKSFNWNSKEMIELDKRIYNYQSRGRRSPVERYGKKYSWIGYYRYAGILDDSNSLDCYSNYFKNGDCDPSFIRKPEKDKTLLPLVDFNSYSEDESWFKEADVVFPKAMYKRKEVLSVKGDWVLINGSYSDNDELKNRKVYGFTQSILVNKRDVSKIKNVFKKNEPYSVLQHEPPSTYEVLANEIPWSKAAISNYAEITDGEKSRISGACVEYLTCGYSDENLTEWLGTASSYFFPSFSFIKKQKLKRVPGTLAFKGLDEKNVSINLRREEEASRRHLLYMDLSEIQKYAKGKVLMTFCWGEKELDTSYYYQKNSWFKELQLKGRNYWKKIFIQIL